VRLLSKKTTAQTSLLQQYESQLEVFTRQAKDQYKKYEDYLDGSYLLLKHMSEFGTDLVDTVENLLDNAILAKPMDFMLLQNGLVNEPGEDGISITVCDSEAESVLRKTIERFANSEFLKRKKWFIDVKQLFSFRDNFPFKNIQTKYDKLIEVTGKPLEKTLLSAENLPNPMFDKGFESKMDSESIETKDENINVLVYTTCKQLDQLQASIQSNFTFSMDVDTFRDLTVKLKEVTEVVSDYCCKFKDAMKPTKTSLSRNQQHTINNNLANLPNQVTYDINDEVLELKRMVVEIEKLEYGRLLELREENGKLQIIQNHIKRSNNQFIGRKRQDRQAHHQTRVQYD